jgi:hypothetical protein
MRIFLSVLAAVALLSACGTQQVAPTTHAPSTPPANAESVADTSSGGTIYGVNTDSAAKVAQHNIAYRFTETAIYPHTVNQARKAAGPLGANIVLTQWAFDTDGTTYAVCVEDTTLNRWSCLRYDTETLRRHLTSGNGKAHLPLR